MSRGWGPPAQIDFDTFYFGGENKSENVVQIACRGGLGGGGDFDNAQEKRCSFSGRSSLLQHIYHCFFHLPLLMFNCSLPNGPSSPGLGDLLRRELREKKFLTMEKPQSRIVSKKGHVNIGKTKLSKR